MTKIYLDNNATTQLLPEVKAFLIKLLESGNANPSSPHSMGRSSRTTIETARQNVAELINVKPSEIYFTSGGTESNNWILNEIKICNLFYTINDTEGYHT